MNSKHTPGEWEADYRLPHGSADGNWIIFAGKTEIAILEPFDDPAEAEANADLIAAAPDLLAALEAVRDGFEKNLTEPIRLVNAAIAKAKGQA